MKLLDSSSITKYELDNKQLTNELTSFYSSYWQDSFDNPYNADSIFKMRGDYSIYEEMRNNDEQVKIALTLKKDILLSSGWEIEIDNEEDMSEIIDFCYDSLNNRMEKSFNQTLREMLTCCDFGFSLSEIIWKLEESKYFIKYIKTRSPNTWEIELDELGNIKHYWQIGRSQRIDIPKEKLIHIIQNGEFDNPYGISDLKSAYYAWFSKKIAQKFFNISLERHASTKIWGKYPNNWDDNKKQEFYNKLKKIQFSTVLITPTDAELEFPSTPDASDVYKKAIELYNLSIARSILMPDLLGLSGEKTGGGSYSLGTVQWDIFLKSLEHLRFDLERSINRQLIKPLIDLNFSNIKEYPLFQFKPLKEDDKQEYNKIWLEAIKAKAFKPNPEEINYFRETVNYPVGEVLEAPMPASPSPFMSPVDNIDSPQPIEELEQKQYARKTNQYEKKVDFVRIKRYLDNEDAKLSDKVKAISEKMINEYINTLEKRNVINKEKISAIGDIDFKYKKEMQLLLKNEWARLYSEAKGQAKLDLFKIEKSNFQYTPEELFLQALNEESYLYVDDYLNLMGSTAKSTMMQAVKSGASQKQILYQVKETLTGISNGKIDRLVRTKNTEIYNKARFNYFTQEPDVKKIVAAFQYSAIMDDVTTERCQSLDGKIYKADDPIWSSIQPPNHYNCRSLLIPVTIFEDYELSRKPNMDALLKKPGGSLQGQEQFIL